MYVCVGAYLFSLALFLRSKLFIGISWVLAGVFGFLAGWHEWGDQSGAFFKFFDWLNFLYLLSWIKLLVTAIKYMPQAVLNHKRRSTVGW